VSANLDFVRSICAAWGRGHFSSLEWAHPEIQFVMPDGPSPVSTSGLAEMTDVWREVLRTFTTKARPRGSSPTSTASAPSPTWALLRRLRELPLQWLVGPARA